MNTHKHYNPEDILRLMDSSLTDTTGSEWEENILTTVQQRRSTKTNSSARFRYALALLLLITVNVGIVGYCYSVVEHNRHDTAYTSAARQLLITAE